MLTEFTPEAERRRVYRVVPPIRPVMQFRLRHGAQDADVVVLNISARGAAVRVDGNPGPLAAGENVTLTGTSLTTEETLSAPGDIRCVHDNDGQQVINIRFTRDTSPGDNAWGGIARLFNRRALPRAARLPARAVIRGGHGIAAQAELVVENLSPGGLCARTDLQGDALLAGSREVRVSLILGDGEPPMNNMPARVRYRAVDDEGVLYGLEFADASHRRRLLAIAALSSHPNRSDMQ